MRSHAAMVLALGCLFARSASAQSEGLERAGWLAGCWEGRQGNRVTVEAWTNPDSNVMRGESRTRVGEALRETEKLRLTADGDRLVYHALVADQAETSFTSVMVSDSSFMVENLGHDFPQRIFYRRRGADSLIARIEGPGPNGVRSVEYPMRRVACTVP